MNRILEDARKRANGQTSANRPSDSQSSPIGQSNKPATLRTTCAASVRAKPLAWLVPDILPLGKLVLLAGDGGMGKSAITIDLAARLSRGECAFGLEYASSIGDTLLASCEDDQEDTLLPRLLAAGADLKHVHFLDGLGSEGKERPAMWSLAHHAALDNHLVENLAIRLVIIDPASAFAGLAGIDGHKDAELRALLGPLTDVAARREVTILLVAHLGKGESSKAARRVLGSVGWVNAVRAAWVVAEREEDGGKRLLLPVKANLAPRRRGLAYQLVPLSEMEQDLALAGCTDLKADDLVRLKRQLFRVQWLGETDAEADQVFASASRHQEASSDLDRAKTWLHDRLAQGPVPSSACVEEGNDALKLEKGLKWWRESILKDKLAGKPRRKGFGPEGEWYFTLAGHDWPPEDAREDDPPSTPDSLDSMPSMDKSDPKKATETREIPIEGIESKGPWLAPGLYGDDAHHPFE